jgi:folate-dependent phosphoribosylglycinamide formyltransferase PurN
MKILVLGPRSRNERIVSFLEEMGNSTSIAEEPIDLAFAKQNKIEFFISNGYAPILKPPLTTEYAGRIINIHPSYLPYGRGIGGNFWSFFLGSPKGVSVHLINSDIDTGDVLVQRLVEFGPGENLRTSNETLIKAAEDLFIEAWPEISAGVSAPSPQEEMAAGSYHNRRQTEKMLDYLPELWETPVSQVEELGADLSVSAALWSAVDEDINSMEHAHQRRKQ